MRRRRTRPVAHVGRLGSRLHVPSKRVKMRRRVWAAHHHPRHDTQNTHTTHTQHNTPKTQTLYLATAIESAKRSTRAPAGSKRAASAFQPKARTIASSEPLASSLCSAALLMRACASVERTEGWLRSRAGCVPGRRGAFACCILPRAALQVGATSLGQAARPRARPPSRARAPLPQPTHPRVLVAAARARRPHRRLQQQDRGGMRGALT